MVKEPPENPGLLRDDIHNGGYIHTLHDCSVYIGCKDSPEKPMNQLRG